MLRRFIPSLVAASLAAGGCAPAVRNAGRADVERAVAARTGLSMPPDDTGRVPPSVNLDDGLTSAEAAAIALWNSPAFDVELAQLGIARADLAQAGMVRNPILTLLFPWGPKQLEASVKWPIEAIWQRPRRMAAADRVLSAAAARLVSRALVLVGDTRVAVVDLRSAVERLEIARSSAAVVREIAGIVQRQFDAGDISALDAAIAGVDADRADEDARRAALDAVRIRHRLEALLGIRALPDLVMSDAGVETCGTLADIETEALASRPDVRAAEIDIEAAGARLGLERSRIGALVAILDANAKGSQGFEMGPGIDAELPLFDRNKAGVMRARAELDRAMAAYRLATGQALREVRDAYAELEAALQARAAWRDRIRPQIERQVALSRKAFSEGDMPYLTVLEHTRRLHDARLRESESAADVARAAARLEQGVGRPCTPAGR